MLQVADANRGQRVRCPKCNGIMQIPTAPVPAPAPALPPLAIPVSAPTGVAPLAVPISATSPGTAVGIKAPTETEQVIVKPVPQPVPIVPAPPAPEPEGDFAGLQEITTPVHRLRKPASKPKASRSGAWLPTALRQNKKLRWIAAGAGVLVLGLIFMVAVMSWGSQGGETKVAQRGKRTASTKAPVVPVKEEKAAPEQPVPQQIEIPSGPAPADIAPDMIQRVKKATAYLKVTWGNGTVGEGSGFFAVEPGLLLTNAHVLGMLQSTSLGPKDIEVVLNSGEKDELQLSAMVRGVDRDSDLAVLSVIHQSERWPAPLPVDTSVHLTELQKVYIFGFPFGAKLGKNITTNPSTIASMRKTPDGKLSQIQVNGGMNPGNSGGPVVDTRGVVIGVAVAGIPGTQINFAIPADHVKNLVRGRVTRVGFGEPFRDGGQVKLPIDLDCLDPLERIRDLKLAVWTGNPGPARAPSATPPAPAAGDSPVQELPLEYHDGKAEPVEVALPTWAYGKVVWVQPVLTNAGQSAYWSDAVAYKISSYEPLGLQPALLQYKFDAPSERSLKLHADYKIQAVRAAEQPVIEQKLDVDAQETVRSDARGGAYRLQIASGKATSAIGAQTKSLNPEVEKLIQGKMFDFVTDAAGSLVVRPKLERLKSKPAPVREEFDGLFKRIANAYELTCLAVAGRELQPKETWECRLPLMVFHGGEGNSKTESLDILATATALGTRMHEGKREAQIALKGTMLRDSKGNFYAGHFSGKVHFSLDKGYVTLAEMKVEVEVSLNGALGMQTLDVQLTRSARK